MKADDTDGSHAKEDEVPVLAGPEDTGSAASVEFAPDAEESASSKDGPVWKIKCSQLGEHYGFRRCHINYICIATVKACFGAAFLGTGPYLQQAIMNDYKAHGVDSVSVSAVTIAVAVGGMLGVIVGGGLADRYGRRSCSLISCVFLALGNLLHLAIPEGQLGFTLLVSLRCVLGIFYGGLLAVSNVYIVELFCDDYRGMAMCLSSAGWSFGEFLAVKVLEGHQGWSWRFSMSLTPLPLSILACIGSFILPESPRWLLITGRQRQAQKDLDRVFASKPVFGHAFVGKAPHVLPPPGWQQGVQMSTAEALSQLFHRSVRRSTVTATLLYMAISGTLNATWIYGPAIVRKALHAKDDLELFAISDLMSAAACVAGVSLIETVGRRRLMMFTSFVKIVCFLLLLRPNNDLGSVQCLWIISSFSTSILWSSYHLYVTEIYPTVVRGVGVSFSCAFGRIASIVAPPLMGMALKYGDIGGAVAFAASGCGIIFFLAISIQRDTSRQQLPDTIIADEKEDKEN
mmetsp:Transcript_98842/g.176064  ORF Transcript_98842/g.176064 Transcript_98842/m.176064 type:complete len:516 (+) Transcript_98842:124-1671(+)|eukprot:CAMPEP_0197624284 /NCGR_PEP_ID=MMETSP1338-20131121/3986_1 /TAXON_ID=43686 ORGANISM="Pelagodinium beii, Strain RCC1491" /NCGR_SAMPLE_ID=MMETSP1338 /ASSEMBLY_ACC=CAM_ASM_000754 /LENGTH=515 /DNA_ID=CAMNT_0043194401 /DNA_START=119 /DNA_END=1666 /DNA_ORIENTATION=+